MEQSNILSPADTDARTLTPAFVAARLAARAQTLAAAGDHDLNPDIEMVARRRVAAVLVPLVDHADGLTVLLTQRTEDLPHHAGQVSFPGGRIDPEDPSPEAAALREAQEEVGLDPAQVRLIGRLGSYLTGSGFHITPVVGIVTPPLALQLAPREVAEAFELPLRLIVDPRSHQRKPARVGERHFQTYVIPSDTHYIWGATAGILVGLGRLLAAGESGA